MKKLLALLLLVLPVMGMFNDVEEYSDEMPTFTLVYQNVNSFIKNIEDHGYVRTECFQRIDDNSKNKNFLFVKLKDKDFDSAILILKQLSREEEPKIKKQEMIINKIAFSHTQWETPRLFLEQCGEKKVNLLSWQYVHYLLHCTPMYSKMPKTREPYNEEEVILFKNIQTKGLRRSILRCFVLMSPDTEISKIYSVYNSEEEKCKTEYILCLLYTSDAADD
jgi:hypothetical protein